MFSRPSDNCSWSRWLEAGARTGDLGVGKASEERAGLYWWEVPRSLTGCPAEGCSPCLFGSNRINLLRVGKVNCTHVCDYIFSQS